MKTTQSTKAKTVMYELIMIFDGALSGIEMQKLARDLSDRELFIEFLTV